MLLAPRATVCTLLLFHFLDEVSVPLALVGVQEVLGLGASLEDELLLALDHFAVGEGRDYALRGEQAEATFSRRRLDALVDLEVKVVGHRGVDLSDDQLELLGVEEEKVHAKQGDEVVAEPVEEDRVRLVHRPLGYVVRALVVDPERFLEQGYHSLVYHGSHRDVAEVTAALQEDGLVLHVNHQLPDLVEYGLEARVSVVVRDPQPDHLDLTAEHVVRGLRVRQPSLQQVAGLLVDLYGRRLSTDRPDRAVVVQEITTARQAVQGLVLVSLQDLARGLLA